MLNWDEYNKEEQVAPPSATTDIPPAPAEQKAAAEPQVTEAQKAEEYTAKTIEEGSRAEKARE